MEGEYIVKTFDRWQPADDLAEACETAHAIIREYIINQEPQGRWWATIQGPEGSFQLIIKRNAHGKYRGERREL